MLVLTHILAFVAGTWTGVALVAILSAGGKDDRPRWGKWIPCSERLPKKEGFYLVTLEYKYGAETTIRFFKIEDGKRYWSIWGNENITAWMPLPDPYTEDKA